MTLTGVLESPEKELRVAWCGGGGSCLALVEISIRRFIPSC